MYRPSWSAPLRGAPGDGRDRPARGGGGAGGGAAREPGSSRPLPPRLPPFIAASPPRATPVSQGRAAGADRPKPAQCRGSARGRPSPRQPRRLAPGSGGGEGAGRGVCVNGDGGGGRGPGRGRSWLSGVYGDDLAAATAHQHHPVQVLGEDLEELHVWSPVKEKSAARVPWRRPAASCPWS